MPYEILVRNKADSNTGRTEQAYGGLIFNTREELQDWVVKNYGVKTSGGKYLPYEEKFVSRIAARSGFDSAEVREVSSPTPFSVVSGPAGSRGDNNRRPDYAAAVEKNRQLNEINRQIRDAPQSDRSNLLNKRNEISNTKPSDILRDRAIREYNASEATRPTTAAEFQTSLYQRQLAQEIPESLIKKQQDIIIKDLEKARGRSAGEMLGMLPNTFRSPEGIRNVAEYSRASQLSYAPLTVIGQPKELDPKQYQGYAKAGRSLELLPFSSTRISQDGTILSPSPLEMRKPLNRVKPIYSLGGSSGSGGYSGDIRKDNGNGSGLSYNSLFGSESKAEAFKQRIEKRFELGIERSRDSQQYAEQQKRLDSFNFQGRKAQTFAGLTYVGLRAAKGFSGVFLRPIQTIKGTFGFVVDIGKSAIKGRAIGSVGQLGLDLKYDPSGTLAELYGGKKALDSIIPLSKSSKTLKTLETAKAKGKYPSLTIVQGSSIKTLKVERKTTDIFRDIGTKTEVQKPSSLPTSTYKYDILSPGVAVGRGSKGKITQSVVSTKDAQFSTIKIDGIVRDTFVRSTTFKGETTTKIFKGDKLIKIYKGPATSDLVFTAEGTAVTARAKSSRFDFRQDIRKKVVTSKGVSNLIGKKYKPFGQSVGLQATKITTKTKSQASTSTYQKFLDLDLKIAGLEFKGYLPTRTKYRYTKYAVEEKPFVKEFSPNGEILISKPTESFTTQKSFAKRVFQVGYGPYVKNKRPVSPVAPTPKVSKSLIELQKLYTFERDAKVKELKSKGNQVSITKEGEIVTVPIRVKPVKNTLFKSSFTLYGFSKAKLSVSKVKGRLLNTRADKTLSKIKPVQRSMIRSRLRYSNSNRLSQRPILVNTQSIVPKQSVIVKQSQRQSQKQIQVQILSKTQTKVQNLINFNPSPRPTGFNPPRSPPTIRVPPFDLSNKKKKDRIGSRRGKKVFSVFNPKYVASVGAVVFNIKGKRPKKSLYETGLTVRPLEE